MTKKESFILSEIERLSIIRAAQLSRKNKITPQRAIIMGKNSVNTAILLNKFLLQNKEYLKSFGENTAIGTPAFEILLSAVCGIEDGWNYWRLPNDVVVEPSIKKNSIPVRNP